MERSFKVHADQIHDAAVLDGLYGYVISVDDELVKSDHPRSPLVIGLGGTYTVGKSKFKQPKAEPVLLVNGLLPANENSKDSKRGRKAA